MGIPRFFKTPTSRKFNYSPLYWDPDREEREARVNAIKQEMGIEVELGKKSSTIKRGSFRHNSSKTKARENKDSNRRLILIVIVLLLIAYIIFYR